MAIKKDVLNAEIPAGAALAIQILDLVILLSDGDQKKIHKGMNYMVNDMGMPIQLLYSVGKLIKEYYLEQKEKKCQKQSKAPKKSPKTNRVVPASRHASQSVAKAKSVTSRKTR